MVHNGTTGSNGVGEEATKLASRFQGRGRHISYRNGWTEKKTDLTERDVAAHLAGRATVGAFPGPTGAAHFGLLDVDAHFKDSQGNPRDATPAEVAANERYAIAKSEELDLLGVRHLLFRHDDRGSYHLHIPTEPIDSARLGRWLDAQRKDSGAVSVDVFPHRTGTHFGVRLPGRHHRHPDCWTELYDPATGAWLPWPAAAHALADVEPNPVEKFPDPGEPEAERPADRPKAKPAEPDNGALPGEKPGEHYDRVTDVRDVLREMGFTEHSRKGDREYYTRAGKEPKDGLSASVLGNSVWLFSSRVEGLKPSDENGRKPYTPFGLKVNQGHNGNASAAARELARLGYGHREPKVKIKGVTAGESGASGESPPAAGKTSLPKVVIGTDEWRVNEEAQGHLAGMANVYRFGNRVAYIAQVEAEDPEAVISRPVGAPIVQLMSAPLLRENLTRCVQFVSLKETAEGTEEKPARPPGWCVNALHDKGQWPGLPRLEAIVPHPVILADGEILAEPGYHQRSGLMVWAPKRVRIDVPTTPTRAHVQAALAVLADVVCDFPFCKPAHMGAWLAGLLNPLAWFAFEGPAPLTLIDANVRGAGKGLLADTIGLVTLGDRMPVMTYTPDRDELRKRITALVIEGERIVLLDNLAGQVGNDVLDGALTATDWKDRVLGGSKTFKGPINVSWYATGNNVQLGGDTSRRVAHVRMESPEERPEVRTGFRHPQLRKYVRENRGAILSAAMTILRGYFAAGKPNMGLQPWGSFEAWSDTVRSAVVWAGWADPGDTREQLQAESDTAANALDGILTWLLERDPHRQGLTAAELCDSARNGNPDLKDSIEGLCGKLDSRSLGNKMKGFRRRIVHGLYLDRAGLEKRATRYAAFPAAKFQRAGTDSPDSPDSPGQSASGESGESVPAARKTSEDGLVEEVF